LAALLKCWGRDVDVDIETIGKKEIWRVSEYLNYLVYPTTPISIRDGKN